MNICLCKVDVDYKEIKNIIQKNNCDIMVLTIDFSQNKKQIERLLFFDKIAKVCKHFLIMLDVDSKRCKLNRVVVFDKGKFKVILCEDSIGGFVIRYFGTKIPFVVGDNIYKKDYKEFVFSQKFDTVFHIDLFDEGYVCENKLFDANIKIISTQKEGVFSLKK